jgi:predicted nucleotidyltransferase
MNDFEDIKQAILEYFPKAQSVIVSGSAVDDSYIENVSDIDLLIVGKTENDTQEKLIKLQEKLGEKYDTHFITPENLSTNFVSICPDREYTYHGLDIYRLKNQNKVIYGDSEILKSIPDISFEEALADILPYVREKMIPQLKDKLEESQDISDFISKELGLLLVVVRTIYSVKNHKMASKIEVLEYLKEEYPLFSDIADSLRESYLKRRFSIPVKKEDIKKLLEEADVLFN